MDRAEFIEACASFAQEAHRIHGVPASIALAQAILESGWGQSELAKKANNYFGIKCSAVASPYQNGCINKDTWEHLNGNDVTVAASFRTYPDVRSSFLDHGLFLTKPRYAAALEPGITPDEAIRRIWAAGYATDPGYPAKIITLMDNYMLRPYDSMKEVVQLTDKVFLSPSDQDNNLVNGGGNEQQYAQLRCNAAAEVLRSAGIEVKISSAGVGDDSNGYVASVNEAEAYGPGLYVADHTNAVGTNVSKRRGIYIYVWPGDHDARRFAELVIEEVRPLFGGADYPTGILDGSHLYEVYGPYLTSVLMELGYHDHPDDAAVLRTKTTEMGQAVGRAIVRYFGKTPTQPQETNMEETNDYLRTIQDVLTSGKEGVKYEGEIYTLLRQIRDQLVALNAKLDAKPITGSTTIQIDPTALAQAMESLDVSGTYSVAKQ